MIVLFFSTYYDVFNTYDTRKYIYYVLVPIVSSIHDPYIMVPRKDKSCERVTEFAKNWVKYSIVKNKICKTATNFPIKTVGTTATEIFKKLVTSLCSNRTYAYHQKPTDAFIRYAGTYSYMGPSSYEVYISTPLDLGATGSDKYILWIYTLIRAAWYKM